MSAKRLIEEMMSSSTEDAMMAEFKALTESNQDYTWRKGGELRELSRGGDQEAQREIERRAKRRILKRKLGL